MGIKEIKFTLNGRPVKLLVEPEKTLLKVLRDDLRLTGTKEGCNEGLCGSCTVLIDGTPTTSCKLPVVKVEGREVLTIEGVGTKENPDVIQRAFVEVGASQCGFCTPGMILTAKAILDKNPNPTREEVRKGIRRNLCRCTGYKKIIDGIMLAAEYRLNPSAIKEHDIGEYRIGGRIPQLNSWEKVTGSLRFADDIYLEDMCFAKILRSPHFHARVKGIDSSAAEAMHGVVAVATAKDLMGPNRVKYIFHDYRVIADEKVRYFGEPVAIVVARTEAIAENALAKIKVDYEVLPAVTDPFAALEPGAPEVQEEDYPGNKLFYQNLIKGDIEEGFKEADFIEEHTYTTPANIHGYLEPDTGVAYYDDEGRIVIYACGQAPHYHRDEVARVLGLGTDEVRVVEDGTGGGFGARIDPMMQVLLGLAVYKAKVPVKLKFTTEENFIGECKRHPFTIKLKTGVRNDGKIIAHYGEIVGDAGAYALASPGVLMRAIVHSYGPYEIPHVKILGQMVLTNNTPSSAMRGFGVSQMCFAIETQINRICSRLGMNVLDFARLNGFKQGTVTATGQLIKDPPGYAEVIDAIENHWAKMPKETAPEKVAQLPPHIKRGKGFATTWYGIGKTGLLNLSRCNVEITDEGTLLVREGAAEIGQGSTTVMALIAAEEMGLTLDKVKVMAADSLLTPDSDLTCASKHTFYTGNATLIACKDLKKKILEAAAAEFKEEAEKLDTKDGEVYISSEPQKNISFKQLKDLGYDLTGFGEFVVPLDLLDQDTGQGTLYVVFTYGAAVVEIEVNTQTGEIKVLNSAVAFQCGKAINRLAMEGQMDGGVGMGVGYALMEEYITGKTKSFKDYKLPRSTDVPLDISTYVVEIPQGPGPFGAIGMGEAAHFPQAPAIIAALHDACGIWINDLPARPERVLEALKQKKDN
ncbi:Aldehyde oxidoreductase [Pelotomaculum schinkii]|uniref:Aldehyde oxidoreductase n=1 Tax=Pelotomaculum schinkii TaxID=78350 RepID=A0A4Y7R6R5_9FIRM|nr:molybdopterin cofactor-binding domain-containing protein [Pelotomaculum schinkii]TEB04450.1 Aldehyde oxidoreductase [Pelotomaculum schinkii]TEB04453.1 Aldehyde oxidoreductase [Pelotomaculum schinkii]